MYITETDQLKSFVARAQHAKVLAIDTEFLREKTYHARLCLLQLATEDEHAIVDPFAVTDLSPLKPLMENGDIMKLFHAGRQDVEILYRTLGVMPWPVFDTQIAAAVLGFTQQVGYGALVHAECGVQLKKGDSFTDWSRRPLAESQISYAAEDVIYLPKMYRKMVDKLTEMGRLHWLDHDFRELVNPERYQIDPRTRYLKLKRVNQLSRRQLSAAREFAAWREERAQKTDVPRKWVVTDEQIVEACKRETRSVDQLYMVRGLHDRLNTADARQVVKLIVKGLDAPMEEWPVNSKRTHNETNVDSVVDAMSAIVRLRSRENDIAYQTLASHDQLVNIARGHLEGVPLLKGWRRQIVGAELLDFVQGRIALSVDGVGVLCVNRVDGGDKGCESTPGSGTNE
ncbi:MAG: ribonuclease D [Eggerthellaceae bacterium]